MRRYGTVNRTLINVASLLAVTFDRERYHLADIVHARVHTMIKYIGTSANERLSDIE